MKNKLKQFALLKYFVIVLRTFAIKPSILKRFNQLFFYFKDYYTYRKLPLNNAHLVATKDLFPRIEDRTKVTRIDPVYFIQGCWCSGKIFKAKPSQHHDIASQALMVGILAQFTPTTMIDIRPLSVSIPGLSFVKGDITALPFKDNQIESLSSICVIEHIGLGRYGDPLDQFGTEKSATELCRVLKPEGSLYISVPVDSQNKTYFNAHRAFTREYILSLFKNLTLIEETYIYGSNTFPSYDIKKGFGTGLYHFKK